MWVRFFGAVLARCTCWASFELVALTGIPCDYQPYLVCRSGMVVVGGVMLTHQKGPGSAGSCEDWSELVSPARQTRTSTPQSVQPNSNCLTRSNPTNFMS